MRRLAAVLLLAALPGCIDDLARTETVSSFAGDSQAAAIAAQAVNPWPKTAYDKTWPGDGDAALLAWRRRLAAQAGAGPAAAGSADAAAAASAN